MLWKVGLRWLKMVTGLMVCTSANKAPFKGADCLGCLDAHVTRRFINGMAATSGVIATKFFSYNYSGWVFTCKALP